MRSAFKETTQRIETGFRLSRRALREKFRIETWRENVVFPILRLTPWCVAKIRLSSAQSDVVQPLQRVVVVGGEVTHAHDVLLAQIEIERLQRLNIEPHVHPLKTK